MGGVVIVRAGDDLLAGTQDQPVVQCPQPHGGAIRQSDLLRLRP